MYYWRFLIFFNCKYFNLYFKYLCFSTWVQSIEPFSIPSDSIYFDVIVLTVADQPIRIIFEKDGRNIILSSDVNTATKNITYHDIVHLCEKHGVEFRNQTFGALIQEIRKKRKDEESFRIKFTKEKK